MWIFAVGICIHSNWSPQCMGCVAATWAWLWVSPQALTGFFRPNAGPDDISEILVEYGLKKNNQKKKNK